jgi:hypothetical protein
VATGPASGSPVTSSLAHKAPYNTAVKTRRVPWGWQAWTQSPETVREQDELPEHLRTNPPVMGHSSGASQHTHLTSQGLVGKDRPPALISACVAPC